MPFYKKAYNSKQKVHYPRAIVQWEASRNGNDCQRLGENLHSQQLGRSGRTWRYAV